MNSYFVKGAGFKGKEFKWKSEESGMGWEWEFGDGLRELKYFWLFYFLDILLPNALAHYLFM